MASSFSSEADLLVVGGDSMIGTAAAKAARARGLRVVVTTRRPGMDTPQTLPLDLADPGGWGWVADLRVATVFLCAAVARLDACHIDPEGSARVNVTGTVELARRLMAQGAHVIHLSSNQVFKGDAPSPAEDAPVSPANTYGAQKAEAERSLLALVPPPGRPAATILRLTKVIHPGMPLFTGWIDQLAAGRVVRPARDMALAPVTVDLVVEAMLALADRGREDPAAVPGIFHLSATDEISYAEAAAFVARRQGADAGLMQAVDSVAAGYLREQPPRHTIMATGRLRRLTGIMPPGAEAALSACLPAPSAPNVRIRGKR
ncbi:MAG: sugar nucleotide-binding protein [Azospirillaceae bacterium]|nr:sugar nucleotide-binding protein [Azospirillaceae bacterium]